MMKFLIWVVLFFTLTTSVYAQTLPSNWSVKDGSTILDIETTTGWNLIVGTMTNATQFVKVGSGAVKLEAATSGSAYMDNNTISFNPNNSGLIGLWYYVENKDNVLGLTMFITDSATCTFTNYFSQGFNVATQTGWNFFTLKRSSWSVTGSPSWNSTFQCMRLRVDANASGTAAVHFDAAYHGFYSKPCVMFTFDDGSAAQFNDAFPYMSARNIPGTMFVNSNTIDTGGITTVNLTTMQDAGWDIANHTSDHTNLSTLGTQPEMETKINDMTNWLKARNFKAWNIFATPNGGTNATVESAENAAGMRLARGTVSIQTPMAKGRPNDFNLGGRGVGTTVSLATAQGWIDQAIDEGNCAIIYFHNLVAASPTGNEWLLSDFQALIDYYMTKRNQVEAMTVSQWFDGLSDPRRKR